MAIWKQTNELEHRTTTTILFAERERDVAVTVIKIVYEILQQIVLPQDEWIFKRMEKRKISDTCSNQCFSIGLVEKYVKNN